MPVRRSRLALAFLVGLLAACNGASSPTPAAAGPSSTPGGAPSPSPLAGAQLVLRVTTEGGFIGPAANLASVPELSVYADGRIMTPGAVDAIYPGPLLPAVAVRDVGPAGAAAIIAAIRAAGLDKVQANGPGGVPGDTGTSVFVVDLDGTPITTRLVLSGGPGGPGIPGAGGGSSDPQVTAARDLVTRLGDLSETWGATSSPAGLYAPTAYRIYVAPGAPVGDGTTTEPTVTWPLSTSLDQFGVPAVPDRGIPGLRQGAVFGADAATLGPVLARANLLTPFGSGGMLYTLYVRPLLPDEVPAQG